MLSIAGNVKVKEWARTEPVKTRALKIKGAESSDPVWLGDLGGLYITPNVFQTVTINTINTYERILITTIAETFNTGFSSPSNGIIQNDTGFDLICDVNITCTWSSLFDINDYQLGIQLNDGGWAEVVPSEQRRDSLATTARMDEITATVVIPDGGQVAGAVRNLSNTNDVRFRSYRMYVKPKGTA